MPDYIDPDFDQRNEFVQPQARVFRAPYRSPLDSEDLNLHHNSVARDIEYLYDRLAAIDAEIKTKFELLYELGAIGFSDDATLKTIPEYAFDLKYIRQEIENLK